MGDLINKNTRSAFREAIVNNYTLAEIDTLFGNENFEASDTIISKVSGQRRTLIEQYYLNINFQNPLDVQGLARVYDEVIDKFGRMTNQPFKFLTPSREVEQARETLTILLQKMESNGFQRVNDQFKHESSSLVMMHVQALALTHASITEHSQKARAKIESGDYSGAITNAYTLVEALMKELMRQMSIDFSENEGDIRQLYNKLKERMNLDPKNDAIDRVLKPILDGLQKQVGGLFELANKAGDRHARIYNPIRHHAKLAVNSAVSLCEFLLESHQHQHELASRKSPPQSPT